MKNVEKDENNPGGMLEEENEEDDEIIINDEYYDEPSTINSVPSKEFIPSSYIFKNNKNLEENIKNIKSFNEKQGEQSPLKQNINDNDFEEDEELTCYSQFFCFLNDNDDNTDEVEYKYLEKLTQLKKEIQQMKDENRKLLVENKKIKKENEKNISQSKEEIEKNKKNKKINSIPKEDYEKLQKELIKIKKEIDDKDKINKKITTELNDITGDVDTLKFEITEKNEQIREFLQKIKELEQLNKTKEEEIAKIKDDNTKSKQVKKRDINEKDLEEANKKYDNLNLQYNDIKTKFEQAIIKIQKLTEENYSLKQTLILSSTSPIIPPNVNTSINITSFQSENLSSSPQKAMSQPLNIIQKAQKSDLDSNQYIKLPNNQNNLSQSRSISNLTGKKYRKTTVNDKTFTTTMDIFPSQKEQILKESKILEIETALYKLQKERDKLNDDLSKIPEFPKKKEQINKRRSLELVIDDYNSKINKHKQKLRELNNN